MERQIENKENAPKINFLNESLEVSFDIEAEAAQYLPEVSEEELKTKQEKYAILLGSVSIEGESKVRINIKGVMQMEKHEKGYYQEGRGVVEGINLPAINKKVKQIQSTVPEYKDFDFVGDIHTHPVTEQEVGIDPLTPSDGDIQSFIQEYKSGNLSSDKPFVFGIAAPDENGETQYAFYRLVEADGTFEYKKLGLE